ncbi:MAG: immunoglobulin domain-containing protein, partial [Opitutaceae bacterium]
MFHRSFIHCLPAIAIVAMTINLRAQTDGFTFFGISKQLSYVQTSSAAPVLETPQPGRFESIGELAGSLRLPSGTTLNYAAEVGVDQRFASGAAMDAAFPAGAYTLTVGSVSGIAMTMPANPYPADIPRVLNGTWNAAGRLIVDPTKDFTIIINPFPNFAPPGGLSNAYLSIWFGNDDDLVSREQLSLVTSAPFTTVTIPAGTLVAGRNYNSEIGWFTSSSLNTTSIPGSHGVVIGAYVTFFQIAAVAPPNSAPTIASQPASRTMASGSTAVFSVGADGAPAPTYQWRRGTTNLAGETRSTLVLSGAAASAGNYNCVVTNSGGSVTTNDAVLTLNNVPATDVGRLVNLSVLAPTGPGAQLLTM